MNDRFSVRPVGALDLDRAAALHRQAFEPMAERPWTRRDMAELLASPNVGGLFVDRDGEPIGLVLWRTAADEAELLTIAVRSDCRRRGVGRALLDAVVERATQAGARSLFLEVGADNPAARSLYSQVGFAEVGCRPAYYARREGFADALVLRLTLIGDG
ncbi:MAG TPA: ribosomal protein S18-alanine N-acetyltransferase [Reyranella sp.]|nr:ribosomal protein S18-alanine N-acetyltransferase [Reyranella sp.]